MSISSALSSTRPPPASTLPLPATPPGATRPNADPTLSIAFPFPPFSGPQEQSNVMPYLVTPKKKLPLPATPSLLQKLRQVENGIESALRHMPAIYPQTFDVPAYQQQLATFWDNREPVSIESAAREAPLTRQQWVAEKLGKQWQLSALQQVTSEKGRDLIDQLFSSSVIVPPGVFQIHGPLIESGRQAELSGVFVLTSSPGDEAFSSTQPVLLAIPGLGWVECSSGQNCKKTLQTLMNSPVKRDLLLQQIPAQDREELRNLENALDTATQGLWFDASPINEPLFLNRLQSMLTQQEQDIRFWAGENIRLGAPAATGVADQADLKTLFPATRTLLANQNPVADAFTTISTRLVGAMPDVREEARLYIRQQVKKLTGQDIDPDKIWMHTFDTAVSSRTTFSGYIHSSRPVRSQTLTELALNNFSAEDKFAAPGALNQNNGFYRVDANHVGPYDASNEFKLQPETLMDSNWGTDFYTQYKAKLNTFWNGHQNEYRMALKGQFIADARTQIRSPSASWTTDDFNLVMKAVTQLPDKAEVRGWGVETSFKPLSIADLQAEQPTDGFVQRFGVYGYKSDILHIRAPQNENGDERHVLYIPGGAPAFIGFKDGNELRRWMVDQTRNPITRHVLESHFSLYDRQDGVWPFGTYGVDSMLGKLPKDPFSWTRYAYANAANLNIKGDAFTSTVSHLKKRQFSDADVLIKTNGELQRDMWISDISSAEAILVPLAPLSAPLALVSGLGGLALAALATDKIIAGGSLAARTQGQLLAFQGVLDILFSVGSAPNEPQEDPFEAGMLAEPGAFASGPANVPRPYTVPSSTIVGLTANARGIYRNPLGQFFIKLLDDTVFQIKSDFRTSDGQVQLLNPKSRIETGIFMETRENGGWRRVEVKGGGGKPGKLAILDTRPRGEPNTAGVNFKQYETPPADRAQIVEWSKRKKGLDPDFDPPEPTNIRPRFFARRQLLQDDATQFFREPRTYERAQLPDVPVGTRPDTIIKPLYAETDGMVIGESHNSVASKKFLIDNMRTLKEEGVTTLYMEHLQSDLHQADLDTYFKTGQMPSEIRDFMIKQDFGHRTDPTGQYSFMNVLKAAQKEQIHVVAIDSSTSYNLDGVYGKGAREKMMSFFSSKVINSDQTVPHKWAALVGSAHVNEHEGVPGLAEMQHGIGIRVKDGVKGMRGKIEVDPGEQIAADFIGTRQTTVKGDLLITLGTRNPPRV